MDTFVVGDRVTRPEDIFRADSPTMHGVVIERYSESAKDCGGGVLLGPYPELYAVRWDNGKIQKGFLPHGLDKEES